MRTTLSQQHGRDVAASEAMYLSFEGPQAVVALEERGKQFEELTAAAGHRLVAALNDIAARPLSACARNEESLHDVPLHGRVPDRRWSG